MKSYSIVTLLFTSIVTLIAASAPAAPVHTERLSCNVTAQLSANEGSSQTVSYNLVGVQRGEALQIDQPIQLGNSFANLVVTYLPTQRPVYAYIGLASQNNGEWKNILALDADVNRRFTVAGSGADIHPSIGRVSIKCQVQ